jgi:hypothetical protein
MHPGYYLCGTVLAVNSNVLTGAAVAVDSGRSLNTLVADSLAFDVSCDKSIDDTVNF